MSSVVNPADRNVDGILKHMREYLDSREQQVVRMNPAIENVIRDVAWIHLEILRKVLQKSKAFGGEKYRVADVLTGFDDTKRKALFSTAGDQNSIMDEIIERTDDTGKAADNNIHDMRTFFRAIDPSLENLVQLIQHWVKWDLPDASDLHSFDEQIRRLTALRGIEFNEDLRNRYRAAMGKTPDAAISEQEIFQMELHRLNQIAGRFCSRRNEEEPYQLILCRDETDGQESADPYDYKLRQCETVTQRLATERQATEAHIAAKTGGQPAPA